MSLISVKETVVGIKKEITAGTAVTMGTQDVFEVVAPGMTGKVEMVDRNVIRNTLDDFAPMTGAKSTAGSVSVEPVSGGAANPVPQWGQQLDAAFGSRPKAVPMAVGFAFIDDGGIFTDDTADMNDADVGDVPLMPAVEATNDAFYFGHATLKFHGARLTIGTAGVGDTIVWEYWNGAWVNLNTAKSFYDKTVGLTVAGTKEVEFDAPTDWATTTINSQLAYWVRARVTAANFTTIPLATQGWLMMRGIASTVQAASTTTLLNVGAGHGAYYAVGMAIKCQIGADDHIEGRFITGISTDAITVSPAFTAVPTTGKAITPPASWAFGAGTGAYADAWTVAEYFGAVLFPHTLCKCTGCDFNAPNVGAIPTWQFNWEGKECTAGTGSPPAFATTPGVPILAMSAQLRQAGVAVELTSLAVNLRSTATRRGALNSTGTSDIAITRRRVEGSFNLFMEDKTFYDAYMAGTTYELFAQFGTVDGNLLFVRCPSIRYTDLSLADENDAKRYQISFRANPVAGDDSLFIAFG